MLLRGSSSARRSNDGDRARCSATAAVAPVCPADVVQLGAGGGPRGRQGADARPRAGRRADPARRRRPDPVGGRGVDGAGDRDRRRQLPRVRRRRPPTSTWRSAIVLNAKTHRAVGVQRRRVAAGARRRRRRVRARGSSPPCRRPGSRCTATTAFAGVRRRACRRPTTTTTPSTSPSTSPRPSYPTSTRRSATSGATPAGHTEAIVTGVAGGGPPLRRRGRLGRGDRQRVAPGSPTAASSASAPRSASPPRSCTPAGRWGCRR